MTSPKPRPVQKSRAQGYNPQIRQDSNRTRAAFQKKFGVPPDSDVGRRIAALYGYERGKEWLPGYEKITQVRQKAIDDPTDPQEIIRRATGSNPSTVRLPQRPVANTKTAQI